MQGPISSSSDDREQLTARLRELMASGPALVTGPQRALADDEDPPDEPGPTREPNPGDAGRGRLPGDADGEDERVTDRSAEPGVAPGHGGSSRLGAAAVSSPAGLVHRAREFGRAHLTVVVVVCAALLVFAVTQVLRARASTVPAAQPGTLSGFSTASTPAIPAGSAATTPAAVATPTTRLQVHVVGAVASPGVHQLAPAARVADAIRAAGGLREDADAGELNLAAPVCDGCQLVIGTRNAPRGEIRAPGGAASGGVSAAQPQSGDTGTASGQIDLNTASAATLDDLPGIGPVLASRIIEWRTEHGRFTRVEELQEVTGIGPALFEKVKDHVVVS